MKELNIIKEERVYDGYLKIDKVEFKLPNGKQCDHPHEVMVKRGDVVCIVALTSDYKVLMTMQPRAGTRRTDCWEIPAGIVEKKHEFDPFVAAQAELEEETGINPTSCKWTYLGNFVGDQACCTSITHMYLAENANPCKPLKLDPGEYLSSFTFSFKSVLRMAENPNTLIIDANSLIALNRAKKYIPFWKLMIASVKSFLKKR